MKLDRKLLRTQVKKALKEAKKKVPRSQRGTMDFSKVYHMVAQDQKNKLKNKLATSSDVLIPETVATDVDMGEAASLLVGSTHEDPSTEQTPKE